VEHPVQVAFCPLLFAYNGGQFTKLGKPIFVGEDIRGTCDKAFDCDDCRVMEAWLATLKAQDWVHGWECLACLRETKEQSRSLPGYYQSGRSEKLCVPEIDPIDKQYVENPDEDKPTVQGCTRCGWQSSFLQLVLRRGK
jgi:hypothetical protein